MKNFNLFVKDLKPAILKFLFPLCLALALCACDNKKSGNDGAGKSDDYPRQSNGISGKSINNITLFVDTDAINSSTSIDTLIRITDGAGSSSGERVKKHTTYINSAQVVFWRVKSEPGSRRKVEITKITNKHGSFNLLDSLKFMPNKSFVKAWVKHNYDSAEDKYNIHFKVIKENGEDPLDFVVDPILKMVRE